MSDTDTYYRYTDERVLLLTSQIFRPTAASAVIQLTGAQVEMLRNMTQYLNRPNTYVWEYEIDRYLTPDADNFDDILAIVANLEEKLMGNENVIWGFKERLHAKVEHTQVGAGAYTMTILTVPAGYVYVVNYIVSNNANRGLEHVHQICEAADCCNVHIQVTTAAGELAINTRVNYVLEEGDCVKAVFTTSENGDFMVGRAWGYKMAVP